MKIVETLEELLSIYDAAPVPISVTKVQRRLTPKYRDWIHASKFCVLTTVGEEGTDASPRGDDGPVVLELDPKTLAMPDWRGNNRLDSLRNIVRDGRVSLMFMVPGSNNVVRVNGTACLTADMDLRRRFERKTILPKTVILIEIRELYFQCAKAIMRSRIWSADTHVPVPSAGDLLKEVDVDFDGESYDTGYADYAKPRMW